MNRTRRLRTTWVAAIVRGRWLRRTATGHGANVFALEQRGVSVAHGGGGGLAISPQIFVIQA